MNKIDKQYKNFHDNFAGHEDIPTKDWFINELKTNPHFADRWELHDEPKFKIGDKAWKPKGYKFPCTIVSVFKTVLGEVRVVAEMDPFDGPYGAVGGILHIFNEQQLEHYE